MSKQILVNANSYETRVATLIDGQISQLQIERQEDKNVVGNIYKGVVKRVLPGMQAAFLELGLARTAFLYVDDVTEDPIGSDVDYFDEEELEEGREEGQDLEEGESEEDSEDEDNIGNRTDGDAPEEEGPRRRKPPERGRRAAYQRRGRPGRGRQRQKKSVNIQDVLKEGQELLVQVAKAPIGTKGARLTTHLSLPGRNMVLMPTFGHIGISRKIEDERERRRLRDLFARKIRPEGVGMIIRTVAAGKQLAELKADTDYLCRLWERIQRDGNRKKAPALIHEDLSLALRAVRDHLMDDIDSFVIDNPEVYEEVLEFIGQFMPRLKNRVKLFKGPSAIFEHYGIEAEISRALGKKVWLKSGGYLLIHQSEALTSIDVNTGRYVGSKSLEETIYKTNIEAVKEIAYQLRLRNVGGIIIIDLIDMEKHDNREKVYRTLQKYLTEDRARTNILKISELGLVEMTRKRTHEDLVRYLTEECSYCEGRGYHKSRRTMCFEIFREIEKEAREKVKNIVVFASQEVVDRMLNEEQHELEGLEHSLGISVRLKADPDFHTEQFEVLGKL